MAYPQVRTVTVTALRQTWRHAIRVLKIGEIVATAADLTPEVRALLDTIAYAEGTASADGYYTIYSYQYFNDYSDHPRRIACAWSGSTWLCSDAAGRYQMLSTTFDYVAEPLGLTDFSPASQDLAAVELIRRCGGLDKIKRGDFEGAVFAIRSEWASLPGAGYGQPERQLDDLRRVYDQRFEFYRQRTSHSAG